MRIYGKTRSSIRISMSLEESSQHGYELAGMTRIGSVPITKHIPLCGLSEIVPLISRPIVLLATATITDDNLFANGLFQNVFLLYKMFDSAGWTPILIVNTKPTNLEKIPEVLRTTRVISIEDLVKQPLPIKAYIEIGMSIDPALRRFLKMIGGKIFKLYLGNILNIDIETPVFYPSMNFSHHVVGEMDAIWVSPHYEQHSEYACALNHIDPSQEIKVAPYVWDSCILTDGNRRNPQWRPRKGDEKETFIVMEPNISFQKSSLLPIMALESWYRKNSSWTGQVLIVNGERIASVPFFRDSILNTLDLFKDGKLIIIGRKDIITVMTEYPSATFVLNQWNNEYNYMTLELFSAGFPVVHNAQSWKEYGYSYKGNSIYDIVSKITLSRERHSELLETYKSHARLLAWTHSPYNPELQKAWIKLVTT